MLATMTNAQQWALVHFDSTLGSPFDMLLACDDALCKKPDPRYFEYARAPDRRASARPAPPLLRRHDDALPLGVRWLCEVAERALAPAGDLIPCACASAERSAMPRAQHRCRGDAHPVGRVQVHSNRRPAGMEFRVFQVQPVRLHCWEPSIAHLPPFSASTSTPIGGPPNLA